MTAARIATFTHPLYSMFIHYGGLPPCPHFMGLLCTSWYALH